MEILAELSAKIEELIERQELLQLENLQLKEDVEREQQSKQAVLERVENLLKRLQEIDIN